MDIALCVVASLFLLGAAGVAACRAGLSSTAATLTAAGVIAWALLIVDTVVMGAALRAYRPAPMTYGAGVLLLIVFRWAFARGGGAVVVVQARHVRAGLADAGRRAWRHPLLLALCAAVVGAVGWQQLIALRVAPFDYDGLMYHLVPAASWTQHGAVVRTPAMIWSAVYPQNAESAMAWVVLFVRNLGRARLVQPGFWALALVATVALARVIGARRRDALLLALVFVGAPIVIVQMATEYVDVAAVGPAVAAIAFAAMLCRADPADGRPYEWLRTRATLAGMAAGVAAGVKTTNLLIVLAVAVIVLVQSGRLFGWGDRGAIRRERAAQPWWASARGGRRAHAVPAVSAESGAVVRAAPARLLAYVVGPALVVSGFWYIRTWVTYGNPVYPFSFLGLPGVPVGPIIGRNTPDGLIGHAGAVQIFRSWTADLRPHAFTYDQRLGGLGPALPVIAIPLAVGAIGYFGWRRQWRWVAVVAAPAAVTIALSPAAWWTRYVLVAIGLASACAAAALTGLRWRRVGGAIRVALIAGAGFGLVLAVRTTYLPSVRADATPPIVLSAEQVQFDVPADQIWQLITTSDPSGRLVVSHQFALLDQLPTGSVIAIFPDYFGQPWVIPLYGDRLQRRVETISRVTDPTRLRIEMAAVGAGYVMLDPASATLINARNDPLHFRPVGGDQTVSGAVLMQVGYFPDNYCSSAQTRLAWTSRRSGPEIFVTATAADACGHPLAGIPIQFWRGAPATPLWGGSDSAVGSATTGPDGVATFALPLSGPSRLFARFAGSPRHDPATTAPVVISR